MNLPRRLIFVSAAALILGGASRVAAQTPTITSAKGYEAVNIPVPGASSVTAGFSPNMYLVLTGTNLQNANRVIWISSSGTCPGRSCTVFPISANPNGTQLAANIPYDLLANPDSSSKIAVLTVNGAQSNSIGFPVLTPPSVASPDGQVGVAYSSPVNGGLAPYSVGVIFGNLPPGLSVSKTGISGVPTTPGTYIFTLLVVDSWDLLFSVDGQIAITASGGGGGGGNNVGFTPTALPGGGLNAAYSQTLTGTGGKAPYTFTLLSGSLPPGIDLSAGGVLSGTATSAGSYTVGITVSDSLGAFSVVVVTIEIGGPLTISADPLPPAVPNAYYSAELVASGGIGPYRWTLITGALPSGLVLNNETGAITGRPDIGAFGAFTVQVRDSAGATARGSFAIETVIPNPFVTSGDQLVAGTATVPYSTVLSAAGGSGGFLWSLVSGTLPPGLTLSGNGTLAGTPTTAGTYTFTVQVTDTGLRSATQPVSLTINPAPLAFVTTTLADTKAGDISLLLEASGGALPYAWSIVSGSLPAGLGLTPGGTILGNTESLGTFSFRVQVKDAKGALASRDLTLRIIPDTLRITNVSPLPAGVAGREYTSTLAAAGGVKPYAWSVTGLPAGLTLDSATGVISGTPIATVNATLGARVTDQSGASATASLVLNIAPPPPSITSTSPLPAGTVGTPYSVTLTATGGAPPVNWLVSAGALPQGIFLTSQGVLTGTPQSAGTVVFTATVSDTRGISGSREFTLVIQIRPLSVVTATLPAGNAGRRYTQALSAIGGELPYTWSAVLPPGLAINPGTGGIDGIPTSSGKQTLAVTATDSTGASALATYLVDFILPPLAAVSMGGLADTMESLRQPSVQISLGAAFPLRIAGTVTLAFRPDAGPDDPAIQFASGGRTLSFTIPADSTTADGSATSFQTGTVAGTITLTVRVQASDGTDLTPAPAPTKQIRIAAAPPVVTAVSVSRTTGGIQVQVTGYSSTRDVNLAAFRFTTMPGGILQGGEVTVTVDSVFATWYQSAPSAPFGSQFRFTQPFTIQGNLANIGSVFVTLSNRVGNSSPASAAVQ